MDENDANITSRIGCTITAKDLILSIPGKGSVFSIPMVTVDPSNADHSQFSSMISLRLSDGRIYKQEAILEVMPESKTTIGTIIPRHYSVFLQGFDELSDSFGAIIEITNIRKLDNYLLLN